MGHVNGNDGYDFRRDANPAFSRDFSRVIYIITNKPLAETLFNHFAEMLGDLLTKKLAVLLSDTCWTFSRDAGQDLSRVAVKMQVNL